MAQLQRRLPGLSHRRLTAFVGALALVLATLVTTASASTPSADPSAAPRTEKSLAPLPEVPKISLPPPTASDLEDLDAVLERLRSEDSTTRETAVQEVLEAKPSWVSAIDQRMNAIADKANRDDMRRVLEEARRKARSLEREKLEQSGKRGRVETPDYLAVVVARPDTKAKPWVDLVTVLALTRMLATIGTVEAARELIDVHSRFGEFLRVDIQLQLSKMGDKAVAALVEARRHKAEKIAKWAGRHLDTMGKAIPSEAVQTEDQQVLADVLRAYGRIRDPDAARIIISFANTERAQVREAARQSIALMGDVANWQLRDGYEDLIGKKPPRDWTWDRTARELFAELDRQRLAQVYALYDEGNRAREAGKFDGMREAYDKVLTRSPNFERRDEMARGYFELALKKLDDDRPVALNALRRAERLTRDEDEKKRIQSLALTLEGEELAARGIADQVLFNRALELDPGNGRAKDALARLSRGEVEKKSRFGRWAASAAIALGALVAMLVIAFRRGKSEPTPEAEAIQGEPAGEPAAPDEDDAKAQDASETTEPAPEAAPPAAEVEGNVADADPDGAGETGPASVAPETTEPTVSTGGDAADAAEPNGEASTTDDGDAPDSQR